MVEKLGKLLIVTPPILRWNATNELLITTYKSKNELIDIYVEICPCNHSRVVFRETFLAKVSGAMNRIKFFVPGGTARSDSYTVMIRTQNDTDSFEEVIPGGPDLRNIYLLTDKTVYKQSDIVKVRALPLTTSGKLYSGPLDFILTNPDGFELVRKTRLTSNNRFYAVEFQLPDHLTFGEWKIVASAAEQRTSLYSVTFQIEKYEIPPFRVHALAKETDDIYLYEMDVLARHANGRPVSGQISIWCDCDVNNSNSAILSDFKDSGKLFKCILKSAKNSKPNSKNESHCLHILKSL
uniref:Macroglobulin domain-containing protein n=1 Tax=Setaria digitata TaxID=48799 RepID=A0A915PL88_9BILA